jgi:SAM-dependent methyltransferase
MNCRSCHTPLGAPVLDLGSSPIANAFRHPDDPKPEQRYPLRLFVCPGCFLVQLEDVAARETHFHADYAYRSAASSSWRAHVEAFAARMTGELALADGRTVVEVGSNDGALAGAFAALGVRTIGVDPAANAAETASDRGVETVVGFFGAALAATLRARGISADLMCANNVLAHVPDLDDFVSGFAALLAPHGLATFEFPLVSALLTQVWYDTIYHEHFSYLSLLALEPLFARHGLQVVDAERLATHGGSVRLHVRRAGVGARNARVDHLAAEEARLGLSDLALYRAFAAKVADHRMALRAFLADLKAQGLSIAGYGAPAKAATLLNYCGIGVETLDYVVDRAETKQGRLVPGIGVPIAPPERLWERTPDVVLILAWNLAGEIVNDLASLAGRGVRFAVPMPRPGFLP